MAHYYQILAFSVDEESMLYIQDQFGNLCSVRAIIAGEGLSGAKTLQGDTIKKGDVVLQAVPELNA